MSKTPSHIFLVYCAPKSQDKISHKWYRNTNWSNYQDKDKFQVLITWLGITLLTSSVTHIIICDPLPRVNTRMPSPLELSSILAQFCPPLWGTQTNTPTNKQTAEADVTSEARLWFHLLSLICSRVPGVAFGAPSFMGRWPLCRSRFVYPAVWSKHARERVWNRAWTAVGLLGRF